MMVSLYHLMMVAEGQCFCVNTPGFAGFCVGSSGVGLSFARCG